MSRCAELLDGDGISKDSEDDGYDGMPLGSKQMEDVEISRDAGLPAISNWDKITFRISRIPDNYELEDLIHVVGRLFQLDSKHFKIHSIASDASDEADPHWKTATITFRARPSSFGDQESKTKQWTFDLSSASNPMFEIRSIQFDAHFEGFTPLSPSENDHEHRIDCLVVHGWAGHALGSFKCPQQPYVWLRDSLPRHCPALRIWTYGYQSDLTDQDSIADVFEYAEDFRRQLRILRRKTKANEQNRPIIFLVHSLGGWIFKEAMIRMKNSNDEGDRLNFQHTYGALFFGVPSQGMDVKALATMIEGMPARYTLNLLDQRLGHRLRNRQHQEFCKAFDFKDSRIVQFFELRKSPTVIEDVTTRQWSRKGPLTLLVSPASATYGRSWEVGDDYIISLNGNHSDMVKFSEYNRDGYEKAPPSQQSGPFFIVPFSQDPHFLGREDIVDLVDTKFESERRVCLTGIGGVGKSQIAIEYCYRFRSHHPNSHVFWIHAGTKERFEQAFKAIARQCKLPGWDDPAMNTLDLVYEWLSGDSIWLMILDNADDKDVFFDQRPASISQTPESQRPTVPLIKYLPQKSQGGYILISSRSRDTAFRLTNSVGNLIDVPYMGKEDAVALLCKKLSHDHSSDDEKLELVELLECLPLAITQAASYISVRRTRMTVARYSKILRQNGNILLEDMGDLRRDPTVPSSVLLTWHISFEQIKGENRPAADLLSLMSVFDRQGIPQMLLQKESEDNLDFENRLAPLEEFSLITCEEGGKNFQMHRLVQMAIRSWLEQHGEMDRWKHNAVELIAESIPMGDHNFWKTWEILLPHSEIALDYVYPNPDSQLLHAKILDRTAWYFMERGRYDAAWERCQCVLDISMGLLGENHFWLPSCVLLQAILLRLSGYEFGLGISEAETVSRRAVDIFERVEEKGSENSMSAWQVLASILLDTGDDETIKEATEICRSRLASKEQSLGLEDHGTLSTMNMLAQAMLKEHKYEEAEQLQRKTLEIGLRVFGENDFETILSIHNLAVNMIKQKRYEEARGFAQRGLDLSTAVLGEEHLCSLNLMRPLSFILQRQGKIKEAEMLCRQALVLHKTALGDNTSNTMICTMLLAEILEEQHKYDEAEELRRHSLNIRTKAFGVNHRLTIETKMELIRVLQNRRELGKAHEVLRGLPHEKPIGWSDSNWKQFLRYFAITIEKQGEYDQAEELRRRSLNMHMTSLGPEDSHTKASMVCLVNSLCARDKYEQAEELFRELYNRRPEWWTDGDWDVFLRDFGDTLARQGKHDEAAKISSQGSLRILRS